jgi:hypothetical protein
MLRAKAASGGGGASGGTNGGAQAAAPTPTPPAPSDVVAKPTPEEDGEVELVRKVFDGTIVKN